MGITPLEYAYLINHLESLLPLPWQSQVAPYHRVAENGVINKETKQSDPSGSDFNARFCLSLYSTNLVKIIPESHLVVLLSTASPGTNTSSVQY
ncbi:hypothetical protein EWB00_000589 [Schistosoma japonicum]|uniref:Uncharacterized protein n=1 Tax=Schistosoma japonicum TaxID=6182 RepID=A0A4Z2CKX6_SCHJA|nr:hypothetical protein EWB00_000589 [Schistosoma japonicum]